MRHVIFFSWQTDTPTDVGRNFLEKALSNAAKALAADVEIEEAVRDAFVVDSDTKGVGGSPPIVDTIFGKFDAAAIFVADLTFAGKRPDGAPIPNPNALIEYGWALKSLGYRRIVAVMNTAFGDPKDEEMPFDLRHLRHPIQYNCSSDSDEKSRREARESLARRLEGAIKDIVESEEFKKSIPSPPPLPPFQLQKPLEGFGRFRPKGQPIGTNDRLRSAGANAEIFLRDGPVLWLRVAPEYVVDRKWRIGELKVAIRSSLDLVQQLILSGNLGFVRASDGFGTYGVIEGQENEAISVVFVFNSGELWSIDTFLLNTRPNMIPLVPNYEASMCDALGRYISFLSRIGVSGPYRWLAGMEGTKDREFYIPGPSGDRVLDFPDGVCASDNIEVEGVCNLPEDAQKSLKSFFVAVYDSCGLSRPERLDQRSQ